jgi:hypothetical protein
MRIVKTDTGRQFNVRGLTRGEVRRLREDGLQLTSLNGAQAEDALDRVLEIVLSDHEFKELDDLPNIVAMDIWSAALAETYGSRDEEKNLSRSGNGSQTGNG